MPRVSYLVAQIVSKDFWEYVVGIPIKGIDTPILIIIAIRWRFPNTFFRIRLRNKSLSHQPWCISLAAEDDIY